MTVATGGSIAERFSFRERARPFALDGSDAPVHGYAWPHVAPVASLVMVHGLQSHAQWFAEAADLLLARGLSVYALDRRGSGSSPGRRGHIDRYSEWFAEIAEVVNLAQANHPGVPVHLVGHCFGANLALGSILSGYTSVSSLVMLTPGFFVLPDYTPLEKLRIAICALAAPRALFRVPQDNGLFSRDPDVLSWIGADTAGARWVSARCLLQINAMLGSLRRNVSALSVPLLVFEAANDRLSDNRRNRALLQRALGDRCKWIRFDAEHFLLAEPCRDQLIDALVDWVTNIPGEATC